MKNGSLLHLWSPKSLPFVREDKKNRAEYLQNCIQPVEHRVAVCGAEEGLHLMVLVLVLALVLSHDSGSLRKTQILLKSSSITKNTCKMLQRLHLKVSFFYV